MKLTPSQEKILVYLSEHPDGAQFNGIVAMLGSTPSGTSNFLKSMSSIGHIKSQGEGLWEITDTGLEAINKESKKVVEKVETVREVGDVMVHTDESEERKPLPGEYEKFQSICQSVGIRGDFIRTISDYMFTGTMHNLKYVWDALQGMALRPDVTRRIFNAWSHVINQPIPPEIAKQVAPAIAEAEKAGEKAEREKKYIVVGEEIIADPDGDFSFGQARSLVAMTVAGKVAPGTSQEKLSELIQVLEPIYTKREAAESTLETKKQETTVVQAAIEALREKSSGGSNQFITFGDLTGFLDKVNQTMIVASETAKGSAEGKPSSLDELGKMALTFKALKEVFAPPPASTASQPNVYVNLPGQDGQGGGIPWQAYTDIEGWRFQRYKDEQEFKGKQETATVGKDFMKEIAKAIGKIGE